ncbi:MAG: CoA ester lyase [Rhodobacteraceae bacterium]|nr:CoA ester lyase [Paracoccaceae bacterium]
MDYQNRPFRSLLYIPGSNVRALEKAQVLPCDGIIFDLEDAVAMEKKAEAREHVARFLREGEYGKRSLMVRTNGFGTGWARDDLELICDCGPEAVLLPKVNSAQDVKKLETILDEHPKCQNTSIWAMMESPLSVLNAQEIAASSPRMKGMVLGSNDLTKDLFAKHTQDREALLPSMGICLLAARAYGLVCIDGVHNAFREQDGLRISCMQGRNMGFDGKSLIHPDQVYVANDIYRPSKGEIDLARRQTAAFEDAKAAGSGIAVLDGQIIENLHIVSAGNLLAKAAAIAETEA